MFNPPYGYTKTLSGLDFSQALAKVTEALKTEGFGVITEIDVRETMKKKLDIDFRNYKILGACNPPVAYKALSADLGVGLMLPCNVVVFEADDGQVVVSLAKPLEMFKVVANPSLAPLGEEIDARIRRVAERL
ncbi:MAG: DUF302 domain-containing protein [Myxococcales bacterium]|nr:MAG: DUF302 domain-containing protein [Myxococcales bacterium]